MHEEYNRIIGKLNEARAAGKPRQVKIWRGKLERWQLQYGAYAPIGGNSK